MQVLRVFKSLHRTRMAVFKDDDRGLLGELWSLLVWFPLKWLWLCRQLWANSRLLSASTIFSPQSCKVKDQRGVPEKQKWNIWRKHSEGKAKVQQKFFPLSLTSFTFKKKDVCGILNCVLSSLLRAWCVRSPHSLQPEWRDISLPKSGKIDHILLLFWLKKSFLYCFFPCIIQPYSDKADASLNTVRTTESMQLKQQGDLKLIIAVILHYRFPLMVSSKSLMSHKMVRKGIRHLWFSFCYLPPSWLSDRKIDTIFSTARAVTRKRWAELAHC